MWLAFEYVFDKNSYGMVKEMTRMPPAPFAASCEMQSCKHVSE